MKNITVQVDISISEAMKNLERTAEKCLLVIDAEEKLLGTLTDGDLRSRILSGAKFSENIDKSYNSDPTVLIKDKFTIEEAKHLLINKKLDLIPVVDTNNLVVDYLTLQSVDVDQIPNAQTLKGIPVVIMAGGRGTRLEPFTNVLPKPLVPVFEKPIIEHIIERFSKLGCLDFYLTVNYKARILKAYFEELRPNYNFHFFDEHEPLGTAGSLRFLDGMFDCPFFVTNCDTIIKANYNSLYKFHQEGSYDITLVASAKEYIIPYGTCELNGRGHLSHINEKPKYDFLINTGLYVMNPGDLSLIPKNKFYHITHLIEDAKNAGKKIGVFPIDDDAWIDVGEWAEYQKAIKKL